MARRLRVEVGKSTGRRVEVIAPGQTWAARSPEFRWHNGGSLEWVEAPGPAGPEDERRMLVQCDPLRMPAYSPPSDLFRNFAVLTCTEETIEAFAARWGILGTSGTDAGPGDSLALWTREVSAMGAAVAAWEMVRDDLWDDFDEKVQEWPGMGIFFVHAGGARALNCARREEAEPGLRALVEELVQERVAQWVSTEFSWGESGAKTGPKPKNLLGFLWLSFALAVYGGTRFYCCAGCGEWHEVHPKARGKDGAGQVGPKTCSRECRNSHNQRMRKEARGMVDAGVPVEQVVEETGLARATVEGFVGRRPRGRPRKQS